MYDKMPKIPAINHIGRIVLVVFPNPKCLTDPSAANKNNGRTDIIA